MIHFSDSDFLIKEKSDLRFALETRFVFWILKGEIFAYSTFSKIDHIILMSSNLILKICNIKNGNMLIEWMFEQPIWP